MVHYIRQNATLKLGFSMSKHNYCNDCTQYLTAYKWAERHSGVCTSGSAKWCSIFLVSGIGNTSLQIILSLGKSDAVFGSV